MLLVTEATKAVLAEGTYLVRVVAYAVSWVPGSRRRPRRAAVPNF